MSGEGTSEVSASPMGNLRLRSSLTKVAGMGSPGQGESPAPQSTARLTRPQPLGLGSALVNPPQPTVWFWGVPGPPSLEHSAAPTCWEHSQGCTGHCPGQSLPWQGDLRGSDLENMSLSKRFLKEEREELPGGRGGRGWVQAPLPRGCFWPDLRPGRKGRRPGGRTS